jgi:hypothetical protein
MPMTNIIVLLKVHYSVMGSIVNPFCKAVRSPEVRNYLEPAIVHLRLKTVLKDKNIHDPIV